MCRSGDWHQSIAARDGRNHIPRPGELHPSVGHVRADVGCKLDLRALVFCADALAQRAPAFVEQLSRRFAYERARPRADEEAFLLDAKGERWALVSCHGTDHVGADGPRHFKRRVTSKAQDAADRSRARLRLAPSTLSIQTNARAIIANSNRKLRVNPSMAMTFSVLARSICIENTPMLERNNRHATPPNQRHPRLKVPPARNFPPALHS
jgi:hypothetical protein